MLASRVSSRYISHLLVRADRTSLSPRNLYSKEETSTSTGGRHFLVNTYIMKSSPIFSSKRPSMRISFCVTRTCMFSSVNGQVSISRVQEPPFFSPNPPCRICLYFGNLDLVGLLFWTTCAGEKSTFQQKYNTNVIFCSLKVSTVQHMIQLKTAQFEAIIIFPVLINTGVQIQPANPNKYTHRTTKIRFTL